MTMQEQIENNFKYHSPTDDAIVSFKTIRANAKNLAMVINDECPNSREKSLSMTKLEEVVMWANASIARNPK